MTRTLKDNVAVDGRWYQRGATAADIGDVAARIGDHAWDGEDDEPAAYSRGGKLIPAPPVENMTGGPEMVAAPGDVGVESGAGEGDGSTPASGEGPEPPPQAGPGSSGEAWRDYAKAVGVEVPGDAKRDDVIDAVRAAGKPV